MSDLRDRIEKALLAHGLQYAQDDDGNPYPLVDALSMGSDDIGPGRVEIELLAEVLAEEIEGAMADPTPAPDLDPDPARELAEELFALSRQQPGTPYGREQMEARLRAFLAEREELANLPLPGSERDAATWNNPETAAPSSSELHDAHVVDKCRIEGDRHGQRRFYLVGPARARADEALRDLRAYQDGADLQGQVAALWGQVAAMRQALEKFGRHGDGCHHDRPVIDCPGCGATLMIVPRSRTLNADQWDAVKAGDYYCEKCAGNEGKSGCRYFWRRDLPTEGCSCGLDAALAPGAGEREAEVLRAAREVRSLAEERWDSRAFQDAVLKLFDRVDEMDARRDARKEAPGPARELAEDYQVECTPDRPYDHLEAVVKGATLAILGNPDQLRPLPEDQEETFGHNCDAMGCGTHHVLFRVDLRAFLAQWDAERDGEVAALRGALGALTKRLREVHADGRYQSVWALHQVHGGEYRGPTYEDELVAAEAALAPGAGEREAESKAVRLLVWVHSHAETGEAHQLDIGEVDGRANVHAIQQLVEANDLEPFVEVDFPLNEWRWCTVELEYDWPEPDVGFHGQHRLRILSVGSAEDMEGHPVYWCDALRGGEGCAK